MCDRPGLGRSMALAMLAGALAWSPPTVASETDSEAGGAAAEKFVDHTVERGENLWEIADRYGASAATLTAGIVPRPDADPVDMTDEEFAELQQECRRLFLSWAGTATFWERAHENWNVGRELAHDRLLSDPHPSFSSKFPNEFEIIRKATPGGKVEDTGVMVARGSTQDVFLFVLSLLLMQGGAARVRVCIECKETLFIKSGRARYCTTKCMHRANKRAQRTPPKKKKARRKK